MKLTFLGATQTVTGSKYLVEVKGRKILVDCGLFQGFKDLRLKNWEDLPVNPASIDAVILTHAHIDHSGYLPVLIRNGFKGLIYCSKATYDLCAILLLDSAHIQESDARRANKYGYTKHHPAKPLYTEREAKNAVKKITTIGFGEPCYIDDDIFFTLSRAGHILGSAIVQLFADNKTITFSGDLGRFNDAVMMPPAEIQYTDYLVVESTYGNRSHPMSNPQDDLANLINTTVKNNGSVLIPSFAVGRAQSLIYHLYTLKQDNRIPNIPIYLDSPMSIDATKLMCRHINEHRLSPHICSEMCQAVTYVHSEEASKALDAGSEPMIIISASGMATGGRILHHLKQMMGDEKNTILFSGFQAPGTRGDRFIKGEGKIKIHGDYHHVKAKVVNIESLSAHADQEELLHWLKQFKRPPKQTFITHGNTISCQNFERTIQTQLNWAPHIPIYQSTVQL